MAKAVATAMSSVCVLTLSGFEGSSYVFMDCKLAKFDRPLSKVVFSCSITSCDKSLVYHLQNLNLRILNRIKVRDNSKAEALNFIF